MGLTHPSDLRSWLQWQERRHPVRAVRGRFRSSPARGVLTRGSDDTDLLFVVDSASPTSVAAVLAPVAHLEPGRVAVLSPSSVKDRLPAHDWDEVEWSDGEGLGSPAAVLSAGHYLSLGAAAHDLAARVGVPYVVAQHGLLTPSAPPLPPNAVLLAWSDADADFWRSRRTDVTAHVIGSQLLRAAADAPPAVVDPGAAPTYLGQLHGAELPTRDLARAAGAFCRTTGAHYRPHPSEQDRRSLRQHRVWEKAGIRIDRTGGPLAEVGTPVVSVFSTGVLEAAARGIPAYVDHPDPPAWLREFWQRNSMHPWGAEATPPPTDTTGPHPARLVADLIGAL